MLTTGPVRNVYANDPGSLNKQCNLNFDKYFVNALILRGEIYKTITSVVSYNVSSDACDLFQYPSVTTITNLESDLEGIMARNTFRQ